MEIKTFTFNPFQTNCYVCFDGVEAVIIDPSSAGDSEHRAVIDFIDSSSLVVKNVLLTHAHLDHIFGLAYMCAHFNVTYLMHREDLLLIKGAGEQARLFGVEIDAPADPGDFVDEESVVTVGEATLSILHTPGHSPGSITFVTSEGDAAISGDVLFAGSIGRTDLWQGSLPVLMRSIFDKLAPLGGDTRVHPGHGPSTSIGQEMKHNPFLTGSFELG